jgi:putative hydrolase of the HAD superfamily
MIRAVLFDAVGTLLKPTPSAAAVYAVAGRRHGSTVDEVEVAERFKRAFAQQELLDRDVPGGRTSEARERNRWRSIVAEVFPDVFDGAALFEELWRHFQRPDSWTLFDDVPRAWQSLAAVGLTLGVASNFDARLLGICAASETLAGCQHVFISSLLGCRKPNRQFFSAIEGELKLPPDQLLLVGDDLRNDYEGARAAGWHAALLDRAVDATGRTTSVPDDHRIATLAELPAWLRARQGAA